MFTEETLTGNKRNVREPGNEQEIEAIRQKAIKLKLFIYNKEIHDSIVKMMQKGKSAPVATLGKITAEIMTKFEKDGGNIINDPDVMEALTKSLITELMVLAVASGVMPEDQVNEETVFRIVGVAQGQWDNLNPERVDQSRAKRMMANGEGDERVQGAISQQAQRQGLKRQQSTESPMAPQQAQEQPAQPPMAPQEQM